VANSSSSRNHHRSKARKHLNCKPILPPECNSNPNKKTSAWYPSTGCHIANINTIHPWLLVRALFACLLAFCCFIVTSSLIFFIIHPQYYFNHSCCTCFTGYPAAEQTPLAGTTVSYIWHTEIASCLCRVRTSS
jgi:hypothetical protein